MITYKAQGKSKTFFHKKHPSPKPRPHFPHTERNHYAKKPKPKIKVTLPNEDTARENR